MQTDDAISCEDQFQIPTYSKIPIVLARGEGAYVWDADGSQFLDLYGGHCVTLLGHCPRRVVDAIREQVGRLIFYSNAVYSPVRATAARTLAEMTPEGLRHVFFCNSGSEANETALKLARKSTRKSHVIAMQNGFHGRTLGSLAVTSNERYRSPYVDVLAETTFVPFGDSAAIDAVFTERSDVAAVILEPIQSMAGVIDAPNEYYRTLRDLCDRHGAALIFDEVQTGVGRTGTFSISEQLGVKPDLITLAKSLGSGIPVGAVLVSDALAATVASGDQGTTFGGGMIAMAAVEATLHTIKDEHLMERAAVVFDHLEARIRPVVRSIRGRGCLIGLELDSPAAPVRAELLQRGIITGSADDPNVVRLMPPLNIPLDALDDFATALEMSLDAVGA
jgi:acetylornithine/succinyldiaminopimelate/putrescine aminotransferase